MVKVMIAAGGTGGHIIPAIALAKAFIERDVKVLMIGNRGGMEENLYQRHSLDYRLIDVQKIYRRLTLAHIKFPWKLLKSLVIAMRAIAHYKPDAVIGTGSFVTGPVAMAAILMKKPLFLQEQNSYPGLTTRHLVTYARKVFLGNMGAIAHLPHEICFFSGNPVLPLEDDDAVKIPRDMNLREGTRKMLIIGGSQGSHRINRTVAEAAQHILDSGVDLIWQTGRIDYEEMKKRFEGVPGIHLFGFTDAMRYYYGQADFVLARAGAITLSEVETMRLPSILVPLPTAAHNHQYHNAMELKEKGLALVVRQKGLNVDSLLQAVRQIITDLDGMKYRFGDSPHPRAASLIAEIVLQILKDEENVRID